jgi:hypothetical protein
VLLAQHGAFCLLHGSMLHQYPDVAVELLLLMVRRFGQVALEHRCGSDVLPSLGNSGGPLASVMMACWT